MGKEGMRGGRGLCHPRLCILFWLGFYLVVWSKYDMLVVSGMEWCGEGVGLGLFEREGGAKPGT